MNNYKEKFGSPRSFGQFLAHFANAIGADEIIMDKKHPWETYESPVNDTPYSNGYKWTSFSLSEGAYEVDRIIKYWADKEGLANDPCPYLG